MIKKKTKNGTNDNLRPNKKKTRPISQNATNNIVTQSLNLSTKKNKHCYTILKIIKQTKQRKKKNIKHEERKRMMNELT